MGYFKVIAEMSCDDVNIIDRNPVEHYFSGTRGGVIRFKSCASCEWTLHYLTSDS